MDTSMNMYSFSEFSEKDNYINHKDIHPLFQPEDCKRKDSFYFQKKGDVTCHAT